MEIKDIIGPVYANKLLSRISCASQPAILAMQNMGIDYEQDKPEKVLLALIDALNKVPNIDRYKLELKIIGINCHRHWCTVFDALREKAPKDAQTLITYEAGTSSSTEI